MNGAELNNVIKNHYLIDLSFITKKKITGIERYALNLFSTLIYLANKKKIRLTVIASKNLKLDQGNYSLIKISDSSYINLILKNLIINFKKFDFYIEPGFPIIINLKKIKILRIIHDDFFVSRKKFNNWKQKFILSFFEKFLLKKHYKVITVSNYSKSKIEKIYKKKIFVLPNMVSPIFINKCNYNLKKKFSSKKLLCVGRIFDRKNYEFAIKVFNELKNFDNQFTIEFIGNFGWNYDNFLSEFNKSPFKNDIILNTNANDEDLIDSYNHSSMILIPSHDEGFCIPFIEGQYFANPIISNDIEIFHEIGNNSSIIMKLDAQKWAIEILKIFSSISIYENIASKSKTNSENYTLKNLVKITHEIFL